MPSHLHEVLVTMFRDRPALVVDVLDEALGIDIPDYATAQVTSGDLTDIAPTEYRPRSPEDTGGVHDHQHTPLPQRVRRRYFDQGEAQGEAKGQAKGEAKAVLAVLAARGIQQPDGLREQITTCTDLDQLDIWIRRAATAHDLLTDDRR